MGEATKLGLVRALLARGSVLLHVDPRREGTRLPGYLRELPEVVLEIGRELDDLCVDSAGVRGTVTFARIEFACTLPWCAVFAIAGEDGTVRVFREDTPADLTPLPARLPVESCEHEITHSRRISRLPAAQPAVRRGHLSLVGSGPAPQRTAHTPLRRAK